MEVLKQGRIPGETLMHFTCHNCKCEFTEKQKLCKTSPDQRDSGSFCCDCPTCTKPVWTNKTYGPRPSFREG